MTSAPRPSLLHTYLSVCYTMRKLRVVNITPPPIVAQKCSTVGKKVKYKKVTNEVIKFADLKIHKNYCKSKNSVHLQTLSDINKNREIWYVDKSWKAVS